MIDPNIKCAGEGVMKPMTLIRAAACLAVLSAAPALAQESGATPAPVISGVPAPDAAAPAGPIVFWPVVCGTAGDAATCVAIQALGVAETDERVLTVMLQSDGAAGENVILQLPHGVLFQTGVQLAVDGGAQVQASLTTSDLSGAYAGATLTPDLANAMRGGQTLTVSFRSVEGELINIPVPLEGFAAAQDARRQGVARP
jgi:invasion protein IalB